MRCAQPCAVVIVDCHAHAWSRWPHGAGVPDPLTRGSAAHLLFEMDSCGVGRALFVSAEIENARDNNDYGARTAAAHAGRLSQLVDADSRWSGDYHRAGAAERLRLLVEKYRPVGVSHYLGPVNDGWLVSSEGLAFFAVAADHGLVVSLAASAPWHADLREVARRFPPLCLLVNHLGGVALGPGGGEDSERRLLGYDDVPNLLAKVSGLYYGHPRPWEYPYGDRMALVRRFCDAWGPERLVWGSDFPSNLPHVTYRQSLELLRGHAPFLSVGDLEAVLGGNVARWLSVGEAVRGA